MVSACSGLSFRKDNQSKALNEIDKASDFIKRPPASLLEPVDEYSEPKSDALPDVLDFLEVFSDEANRCREKHNLLVDKL